MAVMGAYFYAGFIGLPLHQMQAMAFTAWIFGHIALAYVSRSDIEPLNQLGLFSNWVINLWAVCAITVLVLAVYLPLVGARLDLLSIDIRDFVSAAAFAVLLTTPLEARKMMRKKA
jgi:Ca2+-transporting ATPase